MSNKEQTAALETAMRIVSDLQDRIKALEASALQKDIILEPYVEFMANIPTTLPNKKEIISPAKWLEWAKKELGYGKKKSSI